MRNLILVFLLLLAATSVCLGQADKPLLVRQPTLSKTQIVFVYAGDLWIVPRGGGEASQLTNGIGDETEPLFSPDGKWIAFTGQYDGNIDVYVVAATGGVPMRLTYHPGQDRVVGWTPDSKNILFQSSRGLMYPGIPNLYEVSIEGGLEHPVPTDWGYWGGYSPDSTSSIRFAGRVPDARFGMFALRYARRVHDGP